MPAKKGTRSRVSPPVFDLSGREGMPGPERIGFKAHNLMRMASIGLSVPQGFVLPVEWCGSILGEKDAVPNVAGTLQAGIRNLERSTGLGFGSARRPLLVSVRSGAVVSMPGMMDTVLNVGLNEASLTGLLRLTGDHRLTWDCYRRLIQSFGESVGKVAPRHFETVLQETLRSSRVGSARQLDFRALRDLAHAYLDLFRKHTGHDFPQDPYEQLGAATHAVFSSWMSSRAVEYRRINGLPDEPGTAVTIQRMVFGNAGGDSGAGVGFTRDPSTGENRLYVDWLVQAEGEDIASGRRTVATESAVPGWLMRKLETVSETLEKVFRDAQEFEFTVERGELFMLQARTAKRSALAALRIAVEQVERGLISTEEGLERLSGVDVENVTMRYVKTVSPSLARAIPAGPGVAQGPAVFTVRSARQCAEKGTPAILVRNEVATSDIGGIAVVSGVLTASGGRTSHGAVVARQMGKVCLVGCDALRVDEHARRATLGETLIQEGMPLCLDGETGAIYGDLPEIRTVRPGGLIARVKEWNRGAASQD